MTCLYLDEEDVDRLLDMPLAIDVMRQAFRALGRGEAENVPRRRAQGEGIVLHSMCAAASYLGLVGWKLYTTTRQGARFHVGLYDRTGQMVALIEANRLGQLRTGAVTGLAVDQLSPPDIQQLGLYGSGWQAQSQLTAIAAVRPIRRALVYSRKPENRRRFAEQMSAELDLEVLPVEQPRAAAENLPLVVTATTSRQPVLEGSWLARGAVVCAIGSNWLHKAEIDVTTIRRAELIVCDSADACRGEAGDFLAAEQQGVFDWSQVVELSELVQQDARPQAADKDVVLFKSVGLAVEDVALGGSLLERARQQAAGRELPW